MSEQHEDGGTERLKARVYKGARKEETYLYVAERDDFGRVPPGLLEAMGELELVMELELHPGRRLARADPKRVIQDLRERGYHLQLPPVDRPGPRRVH
jgi:uncharacterized protein YcgL (UPF0745 family)